MASPLKRLPPEVIRELRRHVSPTPLKKKVDPLSRDAFSSSWPSGGSSSRLKGGTTSSSSSSSISLKWIAGGCVGLVATASSFPLLATWWISLNDREDALTAAQVRRGAFLNSGSRDVGRDPNWDFVKGEYKKDSGYYAMVEEEKKRKLPAQFLAMSDDKLKKHEEKLEAFAKGKARIDGSVKREG